MCTYITKTLAVQGSAKGPTGWFAPNTASVYFDHPSHAPYDHSLNVDLLDTDAGPSARVALELSRESALELAHTILQVVAEADEDLAHAH